MSFEHCDICGERWVVHGTACKPATRPSSLAPVSGWAASIVGVLDKEIIEDEGAMITARDAGQWERAWWLEGHKIGLLRAKQMLTEKQPNVRADSPTKKS